MLKSRIAPLLLVIAAVLAVMLQAQPAEAAGGVMKWNNTVLNESDRNDGTTQDMISINLTTIGDYVLFNREDDMVKAGMVRVENLPDGMSCVVDAIGGNYCQISFQGSAASHEAADSVRNITIEFLDSAFMNKNAAVIENHICSNIELNFRDADRSGIDGKLLWEQTAFEESAANDGSIANPITVSLVSIQPDYVQFVPSTDMIGEDRAEVKNLPPGLSCVISTIDSTHCQIVLGGKARMNSAADSTSNLEINFLDKAFTNKKASWILYSSRAFLHVNFNDAGNAEVITDASESEDVSKTGEAVFTVGSANYTIDGTEYSMDVAPFAENGRTFVPLRYLAHSLGIADENINWDPAARTATLTAGSKTVFLQLDKAVIYINGEGKVIDAAPQALNNRIFLPARFVAEAFDGSVEWNANNSTVTIVR